MLRAAIVPPPEILAELSAATADLRRVPGVASVPSDQLDIPVTSFGNLTNADSQRLAAVMRAAFEGAEGPVVQFSGVSAAEDPSRRPGAHSASPTVVDMALGGDVDPVADLARFVPEAVERLGLFVDRRRFRPCMTFATVAADASPRLVSAALADLTGWVGSEWTVPGLSLLRITYDGGLTHAEEYDRIALT